MNRQNAEKFIDEYLVKSRDSHIERINSLEKGISPIKSFLKKILFQIECSSILFYLKIREFNTWKEIKNHTKNKYPYYVSRHYYRYIPKEKIYVIKPYRFLISIESPVLAIKKGDDNNKIMTENDKKTKKEKRKIYKAILYRFMYVNLYVMKKTIEINEMLTKKKIEYILNDEAKIKDNKDG